jgi:hypothetical protein
MPVKAPLKTKVSSMRRRLAGTKHQIFCFFFQRRQAGRQRPGAGGIASITHRPCEKENTL